MESARTQITSLLIDHPSSSVITPVRYGSRATLTTTSGALVSLQGFFALGDDVPEAVVTNNKVPSRLSAIERRTARATGLARRGKAPS